MEQKKKFKLSFNMALFVIWLVIFLFIGINKQPRTALYRINDRFADRRRLGRTPEAASQATG